LPERIVPKQRATDGETAIYGHLQKIAYLGLDARQDEGEIRDAMKTLASRYLLRVMTVAEVERIDAILRGCVGHRKMHPSQASAPRRHVAHRPVPSPEVPMRRHTDTETLDLLAEVTRRAAEMPPTAPSQVPPDPPTTQRRAPKWAPEVVDPPKNIRALVAKRLSEMQQEQAWRSSSPGKPSKPSENASEAPPLPLPSTPSP